MRTSKEPDQTVRLPNKMLAKGDWSLLRKPRKAQGRFRMHTTFVLCFQTQTPIIEPMLHGLNEAQLPIAVIDQACPWERVL